MNHKPTPELTYDLFARLEKTRFQVLLDEHNRIELELAEVLVLRRGAASAETTRTNPESFSLTFRGPADRLLPQQTHIFEHEKVGRFNLFIVPLGREAGAIQYQAIFNRMPKPV